MGSYVLHGRGDSMTYVRFAPSPTGLLHPGNARVALQNHLFCLKNNGKFLLRIDDTDQERSEQRFVDAIHEDLNWMGIQPAKTIHQSHRQDLYDKARDFLIEKNWLYPCYETPEELNAERLWQRKMGKPPIYSRTSIHLTKEQKKAKEDAGVKPYWRFRLPDKEVFWNDLCKGSHRVHLSHTSDPVLIRANGTLTFLLASIVDDIEEGITHIIRGEDHMSNTATHIALEQALLGTETSQFTFGHTTLLHAGEGFVLSKSAGSSSLQHLRGEGLLPQALWTYLLSLGAPEAIPTATPIRTHAKMFDLSRYGLASPLFDIKQLWAKNAEILHTYAYNDLPHAWKTACSDSLWSCIHENVSRLDDTTFWTQAFKTPKKPCLSEEDKAHVAGIASALEKAPTPVDWTNFFAQAKSSSRLTGKAFFFPIRLALTGLTFGPSLPACATFLGYEEVCKRLIDATHD